eukprot:m.65231 g.65231  ORF g.65231 m.65231 type:complete len:540 (+) comp11720_c0_seq1:369-1988(+)
MRMDSVVRITEDGTGLILSWPLVKVLGAAAAGYILVHVFKRNNTEAVSLGESSSVAQELGGLQSQEFLAWGSHVLQWVANYRTKCSELPVRSKVPPGYLQGLVPVAMPEEGEDWRAIMADVDRVIVPGLTHWESRHFYAYFKPHASYPSVVGELMCAGLNQMGFDWVASPACTELEVLSLQWLGQFLHLPEKLLPYGPGPGGAVIQGSAGEACVVCLLAAIERLPEEIRKNRSSMAVYTSDQGHSIVQKACMILGIGYLRTVTTEEKDSWRMTGDGLRNAMASDEKLWATKQDIIPIACVATSGTTTSCAFDDLEGVAQVCKEKNMWLHVDAAYGGAYAGLPELLPLFRGVVSVDSFCVNCHKKLLCPFDLAALYLADREPVLRALSLSPEYLKNEFSSSGTVVDYEHWQLPLGRRFRALKLWFVLRRFGQKGLQAHLRNGIKLRQLLEKKMQETSAFEICAPPSLSLLCFRLKGYSDERITTFLQAVNSEGDCFLIHSKLGGKKIIRAAFGGIEQTEADVEFLFAALVKTMSIMDANT